MVIAGLSIEGKVELREADSIGGIRSLARQLPIDLPRARRKCLFLLLNEPEEE